MFNAFDDVDNKEMNTFIRTIITFKGSSKVI